MLIAAMQFLARVMFSLNQLGRRNQNSKSDPGHHLRLSCLVAMPSRRARIHALLQVGSNLIPGMAQGQRLAKGCPVRFASSVLGYACSCQKEMRLDG